MMTLQKPNDIFQISVGETVSKRNLFDLIQYSKVEASPFWAGSEFAIGNTPQQGINWIGVAPRIHGVIIKTRPGSYQHDGWVADNRHAYRYSFKAQKSVVSYAELANRVLILQPQFLYPIFLFTEAKEGWRFEGRFSVTEIDEVHITLQRQGTYIGLESDTQQSEFFEGGHRYVTHMIAERNKAVVKMLKNNVPSVCDICDQDFSSRYGVSYIEAHHKTPISTFTSRRSVTAEDFALLCPNCHKAVHIYMKKVEAEYKDIRNIIRAKLPI